MAYELDEREEILATVRRVVRPGGELSGFFAVEAPLAIARAPGRLDVMGGIADYSGSLVLELPIREAAFVVAQIHPEPVVHAVSVEPTPPHGARQVVMAADSLAVADYDTARRLFRVHSETHGKESAWAGYVAGALVALACDAGLRLEGRGVRLLVVSRVPEGKGVASSAAIEVASLFALARASGIDLTAERAAVLAQRIENRIVGAPCGLMDQMTSAAGHRGRLLEILCQPGRVLGHVAVPDELSFFGIDSGVRHAVSGSAYVDVRVAAFMGYRLLSGAAGLRVEPSALPGHVQIEEGPWRGYLANVGSAHLRRFVEALPEWIDGKEFLRLYGGITDDATEVDPGRRYPVRAATSHPIREHERVGRFSALLRGPSTPQARVELGELMYESHASYSSCGLGSRATDDIVDLVRDLGTHAGLYGAKITGGGSGGTVAVMADRDAEGRVREVCDRYQRKTKLVCHLFEGSSAGAAELGAIDLEAGFFGADRDGSSS